MEKKRVYVVVKTYPTISEKYAELVCTAGVLEDGSWIRLYPMPFRKLDYEKKYKKYSWIELDVERNASDFRPESYRPNLDTMKIIEDAKSPADWKRRRAIVFNNKPIYTNLSELIASAKDRTSYTSLAVFKPTRIKNFVAEQDSRDWDLEKLQKLEYESRQLSLFQTPEELEREFRIVNKVPYKFSYTFEDDSGKSSKLMIEDWEIGMLYFNCLRNANNDENKAIEKVREKYIDEFAKKDLHFFLGTTKQYHNVALNPFIIVGVFYPPLDNNEQMSLFDF